MVLFNKKNINFKGEEMTVQKYEVFNNKNFNRINVEIKYSKGGLNLWTGEQERRGYWLHIIPCIVEKNWTTTKAFSGNKVLLEPAKRFSEKKLDKIIESFDMQKHIDLLNYILERNGIDKKDIKHVE